MAIVILAVIIVPLALALLIANVLAVKEELLTSVDQVSQTTDNADESACSITDGMIDLGRKIKFTDEAVRTVEEQLGRLESILHE